MSLLLFACTVVYHVCQLMQINLSHSDDDNRERRAHAMADPQIQAILSDPVVQQVLQDMQSVSACTSSYTTVSKYDSRWHSMHACYAAAVGSADSQYRA
jgi:STI1 domain